MADTLPVELVYIILSWTALSSSQDASTLCRISRDIFNVIIPISYHTIVLLEPHDTRSLDLALSSPARGDVYRKNVRCISLARYGPAPDLKSCKHLQHVALFAYDAPAKTTLSLAIPTLTHLTIYDQSRHFLLALPLTTSLTHLIVSPQFLLLIQDLSQTNLPNLTHFLTPLLTNGGLACERAYRRLIHQLLQGVWQNLRIIGLMTFRVEARKAVSADVSRSDILKMLRVDEKETKLAVFPRRFVINGQDWRNECGDNYAMNIWKTAERLIEDLRFVLMPLIHLQNQYPLFQNITKISNPISTWNTNFMRGFWFSSLITHRTPPV
ncbi:hypothetical protein Clacol_004274 [Clathrus columnatus]|uniref:F-box domain-containing protein n=1 Tax=Clathrus columnatus TaxID=1419009 RepID=A0AAV5ABN9_9AGAM|nr:hypothetical protein Clacol_004274 [Clathrus columnatus]